MESSDIVEILDVCRDEFMVGLGMLEQCLVGVRRDPEVGVTSVGSGDRDPNVIKIQV